MQHGRVNPVQLLHDERFQAEHVRYFRPTESGLRFIRNRDVEAFQTYFCRALELENEEQLFRRLRDVGYRNIVHRNVDDGPVVEFKYLEHIPGQDMREASGEDVLEARRTARTQEREPARAQEREPARAQVRESAKKTSPEKFLNLLKYGDVDYTDSSSDHEEDNDVDEIINAIANEDGNSDVNEITKSTNAAETARTDNSSDDLDVQVICDLQDQDSMGNQLFGDSPEPTEDQMNGVIASLMAQCGSRRANTLRQNQ